MYVLIVHFNDYIPNVAVYTSLEEAKGAIDEVVNTVFGEEDVVTFFERKLTDGHKKQGWVYMADSKNYWFGINEVEVENANS